MEFDEKHFINFDTKNGKSVQIWLDDSGEGIEVRDKGNVVGKFDLQLIEGSYYYITWMYLDIVSPTYTHQGIGRKALEFHKRFFIKPIFAAENDGMIKSDGSHLTGDAPGFVARMKALGIISASDHRYYDE